ncbi:MAG: zinc-binding dehydrogenase [Thermoplasmata archaeon]|nr:zinc-binding dehydrogenase [Thermoplasmata archaeon]
MKAFGFREHGGLDRLEALELPEPTAGPGDVRIRVHASAFNRLDRFVLAGIPGVPIERPHALGSDGAGVVDQLGPGVSNVRVGDRVALNPGLWDGTCDACRAGQEALCRQYRIVGEHVQGTAAEWVVVPSRNVHPIPPSFSFEEAAAAPLVYQTAWRALLTVGALAPGERVAIIGAGGGTSIAALQISRWRGARTVVVTRSAQKAERCRALGADEVIVIDDGHPLDRALWAWSEKRGVDVVFDSVGRATLPASVKALARGGRVVVIGATTGPEVTFDVRTLFWRQASIRGSTMASASEFAAMYERLTDGSFRPIVDRVFPISEGAAAFRRFESEDLFGKIVLRLG